jgi:hypothetical protein
MSLPPVDTTSLFSQLIFVRSDPQVVLDHVLSKFRDHARQHQVDILNATAAVIPFEQNQFLIFKRGIWSGQTMSKLESSF